MANDFYIYAHIDTNNGETFYIGKGRKNRAYETKNRTPYWNEKVKSLENKYEVKILEKQLSKKKAEELETQYIKKYGKLIDNTGTLVNIADGVTALLQEVDFNVLAIKALEENMKNPEFVKNVNTISQVFNKMRNELGMSEEEIEEWYFENVAKEVNKELEEDDEIFECDDCGYTWELDELIDNQFCPECKNKLR